jgi:hypothetical protein
MAARRFLLSVLTLLTLPWLLSDGGFLRRYQRLNQNLPKFQLDTAQAMVNIVRMELK